MLRLLTRQLVVHYLGNFPFHLHCLSSTPSELCWSTTTKLNVALFTKNNISTTQLEYDRSINRVTEFLFIPICQTTEARSDPLPIHYVTGENTIILRYTVITRSGNGERNKWCWLIANTTQRFVNVFLNKYQHRISDAVPVGSYIQCFALNPRMNK